MAFGFLKREPSVRASGFSRSREHSLVPIMRLASFLLILFLLAACNGGTQKRVLPPHPIKKGVSGSFKNVSQVKKTLYAQHREWKGTRYKKGGLNKKGIDCSGFVLLTFRSKFGIKLPRSAHLQAQRGQFVPQNQLMAGDVVFFKTGMTQKHTGIYLENRRFLHASSSKGVTISNMDNRYWSKRYWKAKRIRP